VGQTLAWSNRCNRSLEELPSGATCGSVVEANGEGASARIAFAVAYGIRAIGHQEKVAVSAPPDVPRTYSASGVGGELEGGTFDAALCKGDAPLAPAQGNDMSARVMQMRDMGLVADSGAKNPQLLRRGTLTAVLQADGGCREACAPWP
jgi:hypothetical protein